MAILKIFTFPDPILRVKATPITSFDASLRQLTEDMLETMYDAPGVGLAANQVGISQRVIVLDVDYNIQSSEQDEELRVYVKKNPMVLINPEITTRNGSVAFKEGCLSVPGFTEEVQRSNAVNIQYQDLEGKHQTLEAEGFLAVAIQHELDHLDGRLFIDRLSPLKRSVAKSKVRKERSQKFERSKFHVEL